MENNIQLSKEELLEQLLYLSSDDLLEIESTANIIRSTGLNKNVKHKKSTTSKIKTESSSHLMIQTKHDNVSNVRFETGLVCVKCGCVDGILKNGKRKNGTQKYKCKHCGSYFSESTNSLLTGTHKSIEVWESFLVCMNDELTLRESAERCGIHYNTAFFWRHKILNSLREDDNLSLGGIVESDETYFTLSFKGNHKRNPDFRYANGRTEARKRGYSNHTKGLSKELACVSCSVDRQSHSFGKVAGTGRIDLSELESVLSDRVLSGSILCTDGNTIYRKYAKNHDCVVKEIKGGKSKIGVYHLNTVNSYHSTLKSFVHQFKGVATKYLNNYLVWCNWVRRKKMSSRERVDIMLSTVCEHMGSIHYRDVLQGTL